MGNISDLLSVSMNRIKDMIDANTIIGTPIVEGKLIIIPVSRVHLGFVSGGSDIRPNSSKEEVLFGGGAGGGFGITPIAFLVINNGDVSLLSIDETTHIAEKIIDLIPKSYEKCKTLFKNNVPVDKI